MGPPPIGPPGPPRSHRARSIVTVVPPIVSGTNRVPLNVITAVWSMWGYFSFFIRERKKAGQMDTQSADHGSEE